MSSTDYRLITDITEVSAACEELSRHGAVGFDCETTSLDPYGGRLRLVQIASPDGVCVFDLFALAPDGHADKVEALEPLRRLLAATKPVKIAHNAKFDAKWVRHALGVELHGDFDSRAGGNGANGEGGTVERAGLFDTLLASQIISAGETEDRHGLAAVVERYLGETVDKSQQVSNWGGELSEAQLRYAARDAAVMLPLRDKLITQLRANNLGRCAQLEFECVVPVASMELAGVYLDAACWREQLAVVEKMRKTLAEELQDMLAEESPQQSFFGPTRVELNLDSHVQLTKALTRLGVPVPDSTRNWKLQPLANQYPSVAKLLEYRTVQKALTSYGENILKEINPTTGRIHANFHQIGAPTGRFACTNPNIQQVPHSIEYRRCFRAPEGKKLIISDYCVAAGTRVATRRGLVKVESVRVGNEVLVEDGSAQRVSATVSRGRLPVVTVTLKNGYALTATDLHRIRVIDEEGRYVWRRIGELRRTDCVAVQPGRGLHDELSYVELPEAVSE
ncbi:MAG TPA: DNA polymerase, partial [Pyrinomonadaceae bacterium]